MMELLPMSLTRAIWLFLISAILLCSIQVPCFIGSAANFSNETDRLSLLRFKDLVTDDPLNSLSSWNDTLHFCYWQGITCGGLRHPQRVTALNLTSQNLVGRISPFIGNLTFLRIINLAKNSFHGTIPEEIGRLRRLRYLSLTNNTFIGEIPANLTHCLKLKAVDLYGNQLAGRIPTELGNLSSLTVLLLSTNSLEGSIPDDLCQLVNLEILGIGRNELSEYAMGGKPSTQGDVYSYGILLLEMITGKGPTNDMFKNNLTLHHFAKLALPEQVMKIVDPRLLEAEAEVTQSNRNHIDRRNRMGDCLISMIRIGVICSTESPRERMDIKDVLTEMHAIKDLYLGNAIHREKVWSQLLDEGPSYINHY
ncbi:putative receptor-like protein kinase At3g47110 isoform X1 [Magnolia sinica]|uniref:putative receptor-like protein kinase At3g47110 isoform X1 n=1 Tax=Magnolia sinica TaxID=86752 RepID=UPI00265A673D|nr:putative receptor-like protein kinase At3g47110 isoform X1 [Magnolia sinica]